MKMSRGGEGGADEMFFYEKKLFCGSETVMRRGREEEAIMKKTEAMVIKGREKESNEQRQSPSHLLQGDDDT